MSWITDYFAEGRESRARELAEAEREAVASGKEPFDLARLEALLNRGPQSAREADHRRLYYVHQAELHTLAAYAKWLRDNEIWENTR